VQALRQLGETLVDVHGQMEYQSLVKRGAQRELLDASGDYAQLSEAAANGWRTLAALTAERDSAAASAHDRDARLELLRYHLNELNALELKPGEAEALTVERQRLSQRGRLASGAGEIIQLLRDAEDASAEHATSRALTIARSLAELDARFAPIAGLIDESLIALREGVEAAERYQADLDADPQRQDWLEQRLAAIESLARKHRIEPSALPELHKSIAKELQELEKLEASLEQIERKLGAAQAYFQQLCGELSQARGAAAAALSERITTLLQRLGMPGGVFRIEARKVELAAAGPHGADEIEFLVSANPGQPPKPLGKIASGGELSRISLAIQVAAVQNGAASCLVFDEVDAGVGGGVAEIVGRQLHTLGERAQVLCVTHLPQVASQAHAHVRVSKLTDGKTTRTSLHVLSVDERIEEIARMLGGVDVTAKAREHAAEMLDAGARTDERRSAQAIRAERKKRR
jgi:DNA repair protein RecN (Recombination protein N)